MFDIAFFFETSIIAFILTAFITAKNFSIRKKMREKLGEECREKMSFYFTHPFLTILINFAVFLVTTMAVKVLYILIFKK